jgi:hypothetical protein
LTPGITASWGSVTVPTIFADACCALAWVAKKIATYKKTRINFGKCRNFTAGEQEGILFSTSLLEVELQTGSHADQEITT